MSKAGPIEGSVARGFEGRLFEYAEAGCQLPHGETDNGTFAAEITKMGTKSRLAAALVAAFIAGLLGMGTFGVLKMAWDDHKKIEAVWQFLSQQAAPKAAAPVPQPSTPPEAKK